MFDWTGILWTILIGVSGIATLGILSIVNSHAIYLYCHRVHGRKGADASFRLAIQNAENLPLDARMRVELLLAGSKARFMEAPAVYAGPRSFGYEMSENGREFAFEFDRLPAYDTWVVACDIEGSYQGLRLRMLEVDEERRRVRRRLRRLTADHLSMASREELKVVGRAGKPLLRLGVASGFLAIAFYLATAAGWLLLAGAKPALHLADAGFVGFLGLVAWGFFRGAATPEPRSMQGYWEASREPIGRPPSDIRLR